MNKVTIVELDLAKRVFQLHGARRDGRVGFRKKLSRGQLLTLLAKELRRYGSLCNRLFWGERDWYARAEARLVPLNPWRSVRRTVRLTQKPLRKRQAGRACGLSNPRLNVGRHELWSSDVPSIDIISTSVTSDQRDDGVRIAAPTPRGGKRPKNLERCLWILRKN